MSAICNRCRFWLEDMRVRDPRDENFGFGHCRREPPRLSEAMVKALRPKPSHNEQIEPEMTTTSMMTASLFPATFATDWCGRFKAATKVAS